jgi:hypothetical protein
MCVFLFSWIRSDGVGIASTQSKCSTPRVTVYLSDLWDSGNMVHEKLLIISCFCFCFVLLRKKKKRVVVSSPVPCRSVSQEKIE